MTEHLCPEFLLMMIKIYQRLTVLQNTLILNLEKGMPEHILAQLRSEIRQIEILLE